MRVLLDTNIFIYREDMRIVPEPLQRLLALLSQSHIDVLIHPISVKEVEKDRVKERKEIMLSKMRAYRSIEGSSQAENDAVYSAKLRISRGVKLTPDDIILYSVYRDAVDFLITEDRGIHRKAQRLGIGERVLLIADAVDVFQRYIHREEISSPPALKQDCFHNLNREDPIFDSLRREYSEFDQWFARISREGRRCWVYFNPGGNIGAVLIYKIEDEAVAATPALPRKKRLKLATFKVTDVGHKIGELFIKLAIELAVKNDISEIYLTHFTEGPEDRLVELISPFGFGRVATTPRAEDVFVKKLLVSREEAKDRNPEEIDRDFYPSFYDGPLVKKFLIPIRPEYHDRLFTDYPQRQIGLSEQAEFVVEGNAIKKAYISRSKITMIRNADIVLFYLSRSSRLTFLGTVDEVHRGKLDGDTLFRLVAKRTVYTREEIEQMSKAPVNVILFRQNFRLKEVSLEHLKQRGLMKGAPQSIQRITDEAYARIREMIGIDERYTVN